MTRNKQEEMLYQVQIAAFAVVEAQMYLDTHCGEKEAAANLYKYQLMLQKASDEYTAMFGPLNMNAPDATGQWKWSSSPWPWEMEG